MPRRARIVYPNTAHHVTQRGVRRSDVFLIQDDRQLYLKLLAELSCECQVIVLAYCLMSNHVHLVVVPLRKDSMQHLFRRLHSRYASHVNKREGWTGHLWQSRYFSCPLNGVHLAAAIRYVELNPVRAGLVNKAEQYGWSSARCHVDGSLNVVLNADEMWQKRIDHITTSWSEWLIKGLNAQEELNKIRESTQAGTFY